jgi:hypothetical protein
MALTKKIVSESCAKKLSADELGYLMTQYKLWESIYMNSDSSDSWVLICDDNVCFHPSLTTEHLNEYLQNIPEDAKFLKFTHLDFNFASQKLYNTNTKWMKFTTIYSMACYAVHTSILPTLLAKTYENAIDDFEVNGSYTCTKLCDDPSFFYCNKFKVPYVGICADANLPRTPV